MDLINDFLKEFYSCSKCLMVIDNAYITVCGHSFCKKCIYKEESIIFNKCIICFKILEADDIKKNYELNNNIRTIKKNIKIQNTYKNDYVVDKNNLMECRIDINKEKNYFQGYNYLNYSKNKLENASKYNVKRNYSDMINQNDLDKRIWKEKKISTEDKLNDLLNDFINNESFDTNSNIEYNSNNYSTIDNSKLNESFSEINFHQENNHFIEKRMKR